MTGRSLRSLLVAPSLALVVLFFFLPLCIIGVYSFGHISPSTLDVVFGWTTANYTAIFDSVYVHTFTRSLILSFVSTIICAVIGFPLAYFISRQSRRWQNILLLLVIVPFWTSFIIRTYAWTILLQNGGTLDRIARNLGVDGHINLLYTPKGIAIGIVYSYLPLMVLPIYVALERINQEVLDAAADLGAHAWRLYRRVILPLSLPGLVAGMLLVGISAIGEFTIPAILGGSKTLMLGNVIANQFEIGNYPFGSAISMTLMFLMIVMLITFRGGRRDEVAT